MLCNLICRPDQPIILTPPQTPEGSNSNEKTRNGKRKQSDLSDEDTGEPRKKHKGDESGGKK